MHHGYSRGTAAVYDAAVGNGYFQRARARFERVMRAHRVSFGKVADVGCGTGLFARYLATVWRVPVYAVDRSAGMLAEARRNCSGLPGVKILHQDLRRLCLPKPVDIVTAHFDMLNHLPRFEDLHAACGRIAANLKPGGWFYFDLLTPCMPLDGFDAIVRRVVLPRVTFEQRAIWQPRTRLIGVQARMAMKNRGRLLRVAEWHTERAYGPEEIGRALKDARLITRAVYDEENLRAPRGCPARLVILAQKP